jgi:hypothetical protein
MNNETPVIVFIVGLSSAFIGLFLSAREIAPLPNFFGGLLVGIGIALVTVGIFSTSHRRHR